MWTENNIYAIGLSRISIMLPIVRSLNNNDSSDAIYLDFVEAFDKVLTTLYYITSYSKVAFSRISSTV